MYLAVQSFYYIRLGDFHFITWGVDNVRQHSAQSIVLLLVIDNFLFCCFLILDHILFLCG